MNPALDFIFSRRSVRKYEDRPLPDSAIRDLLEAAMAAPSAVAKDPWHFIVVRDSARLKAMTEGLPNGLMLAGAGAGIVVCGSLQEAHGNLESYMLQDCSAAIENILLAAAALGLGACWLGVHPRPERAEHLRKVLAIPADITPIGCVSVGWPAAVPPARTRYSPGKVHAETW